MFTFTCICKCKAKLLLQRILVTNCLRQKMVQWLVIHGYLEYNVRCSVLVSTTFPLEQSALMEPPLRDSLHVPNPKENTRHLIQFQDVLVRKSKAQTKQHDNDCLNNYESILKSLEFLSFSKYILYIFKSKSVCRLRALTLNICMYSIRVKI